MDRIDNFIARGMHITKNSTIIDKTWEDFCVAADKRKLILYDITEMIDFVSMRCKKNFPIIAAIDNDKEKQGYYLSDFFDEDIINNEKDIKIYSKEILNDYNPDEVVILILSSKYYEEISDYLNKRNFYCYFSVLNLEYNYRQNMKQKNLNFYTHDTYMENYVKKCVEISPIKNNKIIFYGLGNYSDHGKYITEQLLKMNKNLDIVWAVNRISVNVPEGVRTVYTGKWKQYLFEVETAKIWIYDTHIYSYFLKRNGQIYIQTKHWGSITLKKFSLDISKSVNNDRIKLSGKLMDYIISGSEFDENACRSGFGFKGKFVRLGSPRSDAMFQIQKYKEKIYNIFELNPDEKILIYAPTFRVYSKEKNVYDFKWQDLDFYLLLSSLEQKWKGKWKIFLRLHPNIKAKSKYINHPKYVIDVSDYEDSQELIAASDIVISDFSSIIFEPAYVRKPVFLYAPDKDEYIKNDRELLIDYDSLPFPISTTNEELSKQIMDFDENKYKNDVKVFLDKYGVHEDGHASERAAKFIVDLIEK